MNLLFVWEIEKKERKQEIKKTEKISYRNWIKQEFAQENDKGI